MTKQTKSKPATTGKPGGSRLNAGRPKGEKKIALGLRVPVKHKEHLENIVREELKKLTD